jgi:hypothetical protein
MSLNSFKVLIHTLGDVSKCHNVVMELIKARNTIASLSNPQSLVLQKLINLPVILSMTAFSSLFFLFIEIILPLIVSLHSLVRAV